MFYLRYDDIEGLFRDAAENYQINTDKAFDWEKVNRGVHEEPGKENNPEPKKNDNRRFVLWFLLLLSISLLSYNLWTFQSERKLLKQNISKEHKMTTPGNKSIDNKSLAQNESKSLKKQQDNSDKFFPGKNREEQTLATDQLNSQNSKFTLSDLQANNLRDINRDVILNKETNTDINPALLKNEILINDQPQSLNKNIPHLIKPVNVTDVAKSPKNKNENKNKGSKFYLGAFAAPDVTFIKFQQSNGVGATFGLTAGYQFNKRWSIETGISLDMKKYYTDGEYFDKTSVPIFYGAQLLSVNGNCNMLEMPINIRYKFPSNSNHNWTAAIGTSSYFMTKESYNYSMIAWSQPVEGKFTNYPSSIHLFAVVNLSAGYEKKLNNLSLLIEPYYKAAIKGIGTGNLYMSSAGINIGIKKYFGK